MVFKRVLGGRRDLSVPIFEPYEIKQEGKTNFSRRAFSSVLQSETGGLRGFQQGQYLSLGDFS